MRGIEATLYYLGSMSERPVFHAVDPSRTNLVLSAHTVRITDARTLPTAPTLESAGLCLAEHRTEVSDFRDRDQVDGRYRRITVYQTWRALSDPPQDVPLAVADGRSVRQADMVTADTVLGEEYAHAQAFEYSMCRYNPEHRWYYFSNLGRDEVIVFKGHDFDLTRPARLFHSAFDDPSVPADAPPRASIEARAFAFFED